MSTAKRLTSISVTVLGSLALIALNSWGTLLSAGTWMPVTSKMRRTVVEIPETGPSHVVQRWEGKYLRLTNGSELHDLKRIGVGKSQKEGLLIDRSSSKSHRLQHTTRTAVLAQDNLVDRRTFANLSREKLVARGHKEEIVQGIPCFVRPVNTQGLENNDFYGRGCYSPEYDLYLYQEFEVTNQASGQRVRERTELYDLEIGREPMSGAVRIPDGFVIQEGLCSDCESQP